MFKIDEITQLVDPNVFGLKFSPDGKRLTFLKGKDNAPKIFDLWEVDLSTLDQKMLVDSQVLQQGMGGQSQAEKDRRERMRLFNDGILSYEWAPDSSSILFPISGDLFMWNAVEDRSKKLDLGFSGVMDAKFSKLGNFITYLENANVKCLHLETGEISELTSDGQGDVRCGEAEFVVQEELDRYEGYWLSPDEKTLAFEKYDQSSVELVTRNEIFSDRVDTIKQRYPFAGKKNVTYELGLCNVKTQQIIYADIATDDTYLARACWDKDGKYFYVQILDRLQTTVRLVRIDGATGKSKILLEEVSKPWININDLFMFSPDGQSFLWGSERDNFRHIYKYSLDGTQCKQLTSGEKQVLKINHLSDDKLFYTACCDKGLNTLIFCLDLKTMTEEVLSPKVGTTTAVIGPNSDFVVLSYSNIDTPQAVELVSLHDFEKKLLHSAHCRVDERLISDVFFPPVMGALKSSDTLEDLNYQIILPPDFDASKKYPAIVHVYGGPHAQMVTNSWGDTRYLFQRYLASLGFVIMCLDNRGSCNRGLRFEGAIHKKLGDLEVEDQAVAAQYLSSLEYVDEKRIGIHGWSYGGYMTLMCMFKKPELFKVGVSGAPVTDWALYDTCYTERYMSKPELNSEGYKQSSVFPYVKDLRGKLLIIHGMADDNVLYQNSTMLYSALQEAQKMFDIMVYPGEKHSVAGQVAKHHNFRTIANYFLENL